MRSPSFAGGATPLVIGWGRMWTQQQKQSSSGPCSGGAGSGWRCSRPECSLCVTAGRADSAWQSDGNAKSSPATSSRLRAAKRLVFRVSNALRVTVRDSTPPPLKKIHVSNALAMAAEPGSARSSYSGPCYIETVVRLPIAAVLALALLATLQQSPGLHVHHQRPGGRHVAEKHHHGAASHLHSELGSVSETSGAWSDSDDGPIALEPSWLTSERPKTDFSSVVGADAPLLDPPRPSVLDLLPGIPSAHDPPDGSPPTPRGPPALDLA